MNLMSHLHSMNFLHMVLSLVQYFNIEKIWNNYSTDWRYSKPGPGTDPQDEAIHRAIVRWIGDAPSPQCPLSLHNLVHFGRRLGKQAGDWYGPASVAYICKLVLHLLVSFSFSSAFMQESWINPKLFFFFKLNNCVEIKLGMS